MPLNDAIECKFVTCDTEDNLPSEASIACEVLAALEDETKCLFDSYLVFANPARVGELTPCPFWLHEKFICWPIYESMKCNICEYSFGKVLNYKICFNKSIDKDYYELCRIPELQLNSIGLYCNCVKNYKLYYNPIECYNCHEVIGSYFGLPKNNRFYCKICSCKPICNKFNL
tara:strand:+ start:87 stop:605 length:519 start_codon:yes stop_codon:yes gene_type:complete